MHCLLTSRYSSAHIGRSLCRDWIWSFDGGVSKLLPFDPVPADSDTFCFSLSEFKDRPPDEQGILNVLQMSQKE